MPISSQAASERKFRKSSHSRENDNASNMLKVICNEYYKSANQRNRRLSREMDKLRHALEMIGKGRQFQIGDFMDKLKL